MKFLRFRDVVHLHLQAGDTSLPNIPAAEESIMLLVNCMVYSSSLLMISSNFPLCLAKVAEYTVNCLTRSEAGLPLLGPTDVAKSLRRSFLLSGIRIVNNEQGLKLKRIIFQTPSQLLECPGRMAEIGRCEIVPKMTKCSVLELERCIVEISAEKVDGHDNVASLRDIHVSSVESPVVLDL